MAHGSAAFTQDLDISYAPDHNNLDRLGQVLVDLGARLRGVTDDVPFIPDGRTLKPIRVLTLDTPIGSIDLVAQPDGVVVVGGGVTGAGVALDAASRGLSVARSSAAISGTAPAAGARSLCTAGCDISSMATGGWPGSRRSSAPP